MNKLYPVVVYTNKNMQYIACMFGIWIAILLMYCAGFFWKSTANGVLARVSDDSDKEEEGGKDGSKNGNSTSKLFDNNAKAKLEQLKLEYSSENEADENNNLPPANAETPIAIEMENTKRESKSESKPAEEDESPLARTISKDSKGSKSSRRSGSIQHTGSFLMNTLKRTNSNRLSHRDSKHSNIPDEPKVEAASDVKEYDVNNEVQFSCTDINVWITKPEKIKDKDKDNSDKSKETNLKYKYLLNDISIIGSGGQCIAVLGPSGAGKTTWLDAVTYNLAPTLSMAGTMMVCGKKVTTLRELSKDCAYVPQYVSVQPTLTCKQNLQYCAELVTDFDDEDSKEQRAEKISTKVNDMMRLMGLETCADTKAGGEDGKGGGLSSGQRKRLCIGCALLREPKVLSGRCFGLTFLHFASIKKKVFIAKKLLSVSEITSLDCNIFRDQSNTQLFLDEPSTGLDAASAYRVLAYVKNMAREKNMLVVTTIHQPSYELWAMFDRVMIMATGRVAYVGQSGNDIDNFFSSELCGNHVVPPFTNPAEYYLDRVNSDFASKEQLDQILNAWEIKGASEHRQTVVRQTRNTINLTESRRMTRLATASSNAKLAAELEKLDSFNENKNAFKKLMILLRREIHVTCWTNPSVYLHRYILYYISCFMFTLTYVKNFKENQLNYFYKFWMMLWIVCSQPVFSVTAAVYLNKSFKLTSGEIRNGFYRPWMYMTAVLIVSLPMIFLLACTCIFGTSYGAGNLFAGPGGVNMFMNLAVLYLLHLAFEYYSHLSSAMWDAPLMVLLDIVNYWFFSFLFMGFMINLEQVIWPFRLLTYPYPYRWAYNAFSYIDLAWTARTINGASPCAAGTPATPQNGCFFETTKQVGPAQVGTSEGFTCGALGSYDNFCLGYTGNQVFNTMNRLSYTIIKDDNQVDLDMGILIVLIVVHKVAHWLVFTRKALRSPVMQSLDKRPEGYHGSGATAADAIQEEEEEHSGLHDTLETVEEEEGHRIGVEGGGVRGGTNEAAEAVARSTEAADAVVTEDAVEVDLADERNDSKEVSSAAFVTPRAE